MKAYLIEPEMRRITEVNYDGDYRNIYRLCGWDCFDLIRLDGGNCIAVDDEGLMKGGPLHFFAFGNHPTPICGKALVIGPESEEDKKGDTVQLDCSLTLEEIERAVIFVTPEQAVEIHNDVRRDMQSDIAILKARGIDAFVIDASVELGIDDDGNVRID